MSSGDKLDIYTEKLAGAAAQATATQTGSITPALATPPATTVSQLDGALVGFLGALEGKRTASDQADSVIATKQESALTQSPPAIIAQDEQLANDFGGRPLIMPTPKAATAPVPGTVYNI